VDTFFWWTVLSIGWLGSIRRFIPILNGHVLRGGPIHTLPFYWNRKQICAIYKNNWGAVAAAPQKSVPMWVFTIFNPEWSIEMIQQIRRPYDDHWAILLHLNMDEKYAYTHPNWAHMCIFIIHISKLCAAVSTLLAYSSHGAFLLWMATHHGYSAWLLWLVEGRLLRTAS
jgi:hypothetical protein